MKTSYTRIRRPDVGDKYDKQASGFDPSNDVDVLDEIDSAISRIAAGISLSNTGRVLCDTLELQLDKSSKSTYRYFLSGNEVYDTTCYKIGTTNASKSLRWVADANSGNSIIVVGNDGYIMKGDSGGNWSEKTSGVTKTLYAVAEGAAWSTPAVIAAGQDGTAVKSTDNGDTWSDITADFNNAHTSYAVAVGGQSNNIMAFTTYSDVVYSSDGASWTSVAVGVDDLGAILWDGEYWVVSGYGDKVAISSDLSTWIVSTLPTDVGVQGFFSPVRYGDVLSFTSLNYQYGIPMSAVLVDRVALASGVVSGFAKTNLNKNSQVVDDELSLCSLGGKTYEHLFVPMGG